MSLFSSLYTGVGGMMAQSEATGVISTNVANSTTVGFKKSDSVFHDLVINKTKPNKFSSGGVYTTQVLRADQQGALKQTYSTTELGINGAGFFAVKTTDDPNVEFLYTRNGSFSPDRDGVLRNAAGFILYGWPVSPDGSVASGTDLSSLQVVDIDDLNATFRQTTSAELSINLDSAEEVYNPLVLGQSYPVNNLSANFARAISAVDGDGNAHNLNFEFRKISGPMAYATSGTLGIDHLTSLTDGNFFANITAGDSFTISASGNTQEYIIGAPAGPGQVRVDTVGDLTNHINTQFGDIDNDGIFGDIVDATIDSEGRLIFKQKDLTDNLTFTETSGSPLTGPNTINLIQQPGSPALFYSALDISTAYPDQTDFPSIDLASRPSTNGWWEVTVTTPDPSDPNNPALSTVPIRTGLISFNSDGTLNAIPDADGNLTVNLTGINFDDGSTTDTTDITVDITRFSQFAGSYNVIVEDHNGAEAGSLTGVQITTDGRVIGEFSNSERFEIFQIPLVHFVNPNGLQAITGTVFAQTEDAGDLAILEAGTGGTGLIQSATIENSNVDLADEFANLIVSQRAYQANSRVVNTVDEMTQQLRQLKS